MKRDFRHEEDDDDDDEGEDEDDGESYDDGDDNDFAATAAATRSSPGISSPAQHDIICGRGKMTSSHPGNRRFRDLVLEKKQAYQRARRRDDKTRITFELVQTLRDAGRYVDRMLPSWTSVVLYCISRY